MSWYVVHTKPRMELLAATLIEERLGLDTYYPEVIQHRHGRDEQTAFFPCYLFVATGMQASLPAVDCTPGVVRVVRFQDEPCVVADEVVQQLRERIDRINAAGGLPTHQFHLGDAVRITSGPLQGLEGIFDGPITPAERVLVLLRFLGGERRVAVDAGVLEPDHNPQSGMAQKRVRRSRGVGRPIANKGQAVPPRSES